MTNNLLRSFCKDSKMNVWGLIVSTGPDRRNITDK